MIALVYPFQEEMKRKGFPECYLEIHCPLSKDPYIMTNSPNIQRQLKEYFQKNEIDPRDLSYDDVAAIAYDYVQDNIPPQLEDDEDSGWYDETFDMWTSYCAYYVTYVCFMAYMHDHAYCVDR